MGADYRKSAKSLIGFAVASQAANTTRYIGISLANAALDRVSIPIPYPGHIEILQAHTSAAPGAGETFTYTVFINGIATPITCQIVNPNQIAADLVNVVAVAQGDRVEIRLVTSLNAAVVNHTMSLGYRT